MVTKQDQLGTMSAMLSGDAPMLGGSAPDTVSCRSCGATLDSASGDVVGPVGPENVEQVRMFVQESGKAEMGGVQLDTPSGQYL